MSTLSALSLPLAWMPGPWEIGLILVIVLIFFGVGKLPNVLGQLGSGVKAFKDGMKDDDEKMARAIDAEPGAARSKVTEADEVRR
jgi:sec-independent protein translocase protein TatA